MNNKTARPVQLEISNKRAQRWQAWCSQFRLDVAADPRLPAAAKLLAIIILEDANHKTGMAWPGRKRLERRTCLSPSYLHELLEALAACGHFWVRDRTDARGTLYIALVGGNPWSPQAVENLAANIRPAEQTIRPAERNVRPAERHIEPLTEPQREPTAGTVACAVDAAPAPAVPEDKPADITATESSSEAYRRWLNTPNHLRGELPLLKRKVTP